MNVKTNLWLLTSLLLAMLAGCGGGGSSTTSTPPPPTVVAVGTSTPTAIGGANVSSTGSLYIQEAALTQTNYQTTSVENTLWNFLHYGTASTNPYSGNSTSTHYGTLISDHSGNLFATENDINSSSNGFRGATLYIVEFPGGAGATSTTSTLTPTTIITLPTGIVVNSMAFDGSGNLWVDEADQADSAAKIVEYTSASSYASTGTVINYSATGGTGLPSSSILAFAMPTASVNPGVLYAFENYYNSSNGGGTNLVAYNVTSTPGSATPVPLPAAITSQFWTARFSTLTIDQAGYIWLLSSGCATCTTASPAYVREFNPNSTTGSLLKTFTLSSSFAYIGGGKGARPMFDSNNNLWFTASTGPSCVSGTAYGVYEIPSATTAPASTAPVTAYTSSTACNEFTAVAVVPALD